MIWRTESLIHYDTNELERVADAVAAEGNCITARGVLRQYLHKVLKTIERRKILFPCLTGEGRQIGLLLLNQRYPGLPGLPFYWRFQARPADKLEMVVLLFEVFSDVERVIIPSFVAACDSGERTAELAVGAGLRLGGHDKPLLKFHEAPYMKVGT